MKVLLFPTSLRVSLVIFSVILSDFACSPDPDVKIPEAMGRQGGDALPYNSVSSTDTIEGAINGESTPTSGEASPAATPPSVSTPSPATSGASTAATGSQTGTPAAASGPIATPATDASPIDLTIPDGVYLIKNVESDKCMEVPEGRTDDGLRLQIAACSQSSFYQMVSLQMLDTSYYRLNSAYEKSFEGDSDDLSPGSPFQQGTPTGTDNQQYTFERTGDGLSYYIRLKANRLVIELIGSQTGSGTLLQFNAQNPLASQRWVLMKL